MQVAGIPSINRNYGRRELDKRYGKTCCFRMKLALWIALLELLCNQIYTKVVKEENIDFDYDEDAYAMYSDFYSGYTGEEDFGAAVPPIASEAYLIAMENEVGCTMKTWMGKALDKKRAKGGKSELERIEEAKRQAEMRMRGAHFHSSEDHNNVHDESMYDDYGGYYGDEDGKGDDTDPTIKRDSDTVGEERRHKWQKYAEQLQLGLLDSRKFAELVRDTLPSSGGAVSAYKGIRDDTLWAQLTALEGVSTDPQREAAIASVLRLDLSALQAATPVGERYRRLSSRLLPSEEAARAEMEEALQRRQVERRKVREHTFGPSCESITCEACCMIVSDLSTSPPHRDPETRQRWCSQGLYAFGPLQRMCRTLTASAHSQSYLDLLRKTHADAHVNHTTAVAACTSLGACSPQTYRHDTFDGAVKHVTAVCEECMAVGSLLETRLYFLGAQVAGKDRWAEVDEEAMEMLIRKACIDLDMESCSILMSDPYTAAWFASQHFEKYYQAEATDRSTPSTFATLFCRVAGACGASPEETRA